MTTFFIFVGLAALVGLGILFYRSRGLNPGDSRRPSPALPGIEDIQPGGILKLTRVGTDLSDFDVRVIARHVYREDGFEWTELEGEAGHGPVWIEVERDDELSVSVALRRLRLGDIGLDAAALDAFVSADEGQVGAEGISYEYEDHGRADFLRNGDPARREPVVYWDFESSDGRRFLGVERWGDDDYQVHLGEALSPGQIEIYSAGEDTLEPR